MKPPATTRFRRGPERRKTAISPAGERRHAERRSAALRWVALFRDADPGDLEAALADSAVLQLPAGAPLLRSGATNHSVYILLSGRLGVQLGDDANAEQAIPILPGECVGEFSAIDGKPVSAQVIAVSAVRVLRLDGQVFWDNMMQLRGVAKNLLITLTERMRRANEQALAAQRERLELQHIRRELDVARQLQTSMLPLQRPMFPGRSDIEACGYMEPASKVGGDLLDAFFVDRRTLFVCIGDVSGHGIAAALFMVRVIGLLRMLAMETRQPESLLSALNDRLCVGNDTQLFVTLFCGFLDVESGRLVYSNGGHCPPLVCTGREVAPLPLPKGIVLGVADGRPYSSMEYLLAPGEMLFCYTDGVTEAENPAGVQFSEEGCLEVLRGGTTLSLPALLDALYEQVVSHTGSQLPADDVTMLAVRRLAPGG